MAVTDLVELVTDASDKKMSTIGVFIDLKKVFDTLHMEIIVKKLEHYGYEVLHLNGLLVTWQSESNM